MLRRNGPVVKSVESVLRLEASLWWERFVKEVGQDSANEESWLRHCTVVVGNTDGHHCSRVVYHGMEAPPSHKHSSG